MFWGVENTHRNHGYKLLVKLNLSNRLCFDIVNCALFKIFVSAGIDSLGLVLHQQMSPNYRILLNDGGVITCGDG